MKKQGRGCEVKGGDQGRPPEGRVGGEGSDGDIGSGVPGRGSTLKRLGLFKEGQGHMSKGWRSWKGRQESSRQRPGEPL